MQSDLLEDGVRVYARLDLAHKAVMLQDAREVLSMDRRQAREMNQMAINDGEEIGGEGDEMGDIHIGDTFHAAPIPNPKPPKSSIGTLGKIVAAGALMATGGGIAAAVPLVVELLKDKPVPQVQDTDTDTHYEFDLPDAE